jgi:hypothetical protein
MAASAKIPGYDSSAALLLKHENEEMTKYCLKIIMAEEGGIEEENCQL